MTTTLLNLPVLASFFFCVVSRAATADNGLVSVSSDSPSVRGIIAVGDDFAVFQDKSLDRASADTSLPKTGPVPSNPFDIKEWSLVMRTEDGKIIAGETEGGQTE